jgi:hypothetical protein
MFDGNLPISGYRKRLRFIRRETPAGKARLGETPQAQGAEGRTARGKRVPVVEIDGIN